MDSKTIGKKNKRNKDLTVDFLNLCDSLALPTQMFSLYYQPDGLFIAIQPDDCFVSKLATVDVDFENQYATVQDKQELHCFILGVFDKLHKIQGVQF